MKREEGKRREDEIEQEEGMEEAEEKGESYWRR